jgi:hypothetical protein
MNTFSDSITIGIVITLVFGALFFYLYSRQVQNEKRVSLIENILLDLKMSTDANQSWGSANWGVGRDSDEANENHDHGEQSEQGEQKVRNSSVNHVEPVSAPEPLASDDLDTSEEDLYKDVLANATDEVKSFDISGAKNGSSKSGTSVSVSKVQPNYASMTIKELKALAKQRGLAFPSGAGKKEITEALRKQDGGAKAESPEPTGFLENQEGAFLDAEAETL